MRILGAGASLIVILIFALAMVFPFWRIAKKMGYPGIVGMIAFIPGLNLVLAYYLALSEWPALRSRHP